jgi:hypothetical protein
MARTPRATVSKTSGQGISRGSYQKARTLGGGTPAIKDSTKADTNFGGKRGISGKTKDYSKEAGGFNVSYGDTLFPTDLNDVKEFGAGPAGKSSPIAKPAKPKAWKIK